MRYQISCLERDNYDLQEKLAEFTNKDLYEIGLQTDEVKVNEVEINTVITGDI